MEEIIKLEIKLAIERAKSAAHTDTISTLLLSGEKGTGKTFISELICQYFCKSAPALDDNYFFMQCHGGTTPSHFFYDINAAEVVNSLGVSQDALYLREWIAADVAQMLIPNDHNANICKEKIQHFAVQQREVISKGILIKALEMSHKKKVVMVLDEFDKTLRDLDAFMLDFLQNCRVTDPVYGNVVGNKNNMIVIITSNDERHFSEPLYRRVTTLHIEYPDNAELAKRIWQNMPDMKFTTDFVDATIKLVDDIRQIKGLNYQPTISEIMRLLQDLKLIHKRSEPELKYFICRTLSPFKEDRILIAAFDRLTKFLTFLSEDYRETIFKK